MFPLNTFENLCVFFLLLMIYSAAGWVGEMFYCSVGKGHICEKRGFLNGFICPIYGHGALLVLYVLHGGLKNPLLTFLAGMALTSALEYFTSWFMEAVFHMRWWDYSRKKIQLNGRICLQNSLLFAGALANKKVPFELHIYPYGEHGLSLATKEVEEPEKKRYADAHVAGWFGQCAEWLEEMFGGKRAE